MKTVKWKNKKYRKKPIWNIENYFIPLGLQNTFFSYVLLFWAGIIIISRSFILVSLLCC